MPKYRIVSEPGPGAEHREPRGANLYLGKDCLVTVIESEDLFWATRTAYSSSLSEHLDRRIVSIEEIHPGFTFSDDEVTRALKRAALAGIPLVDPDGFEDGTTPFCDSDDFSVTVQMVAMALRESGLVPGLSTSVLANENDEPHVMVKVHDGARNVYLSRGSEVRQFTDDCEAAGWAGVLAVARGLISFSNDLH
ncbi:hypothetical protein [Streptomyces acidiscabies]|uniref:Uncharacterized protein n=1 Tax=Streptomyces acidiscabies TaxID=42234 RepID=A0ABU4LY02_9ACTN|nr:hypothetical protein [Streptomyces acidiscabies]MDX3020100.1 hypothetical protein [Streptomyces acidiscabies]